MPKPRKSQGLIPKKAPSPLQSEPKVKCISRLDETNSVVQTRGRQPADPVTPEYREAKAAEITYLLGREDDEPAFPDRAVILEGTLYQLHKDAKEHDIGAFSDKVVEYLILMNTRNSDPETRARLRAESMERLAVIASVKEHTAMDAHDGSSVITVEEVFLAANRCNFHEVNEEESEHPEGDGDCAATKAASIAFVLGRIGDDPAFPDRYVILEGKLYLLHKDAKEHDIGAFADKVADYIMLMNGRDRPEQETWSCLRAEVMDRLAVIAHLREHFDIQMDDGTITTNIKEVFLSVSRCNTMVINPNAVALRIDSIEGDEYEEVGILGDIKCKCVIS